MKVGFTPVLMDWAPLVLRAEFGLVFGDMVSSAVSAARSGLEGDDVVGPDLKLSSCLASAGWASSKKTLVPLPWSAGPSWCHRDMILKFLVSLYKC